MKIIFIILMLNICLSDKKPIDKIEEDKIEYWENEDKTVTLSAIDAEQQLSVTEHDDLIQIGKDVNIMLKTAIDLV